MNATHLSGVWLMLARENFLHIAVALFLLCSVVLVLVSVATAAPARAQLANVTFATLERTTTNRAPTNLVRQDVVVSAVLTLLVFVVWGMFTG